MEIKGRFARSLLATALAIAFSLVFTGWSSLGASTRAPSLRHPLDPLTKEELITTVAVLKKSGRLAPDSRFATIYLKEPPKDQVTSDIAEGRAKRAAFALLYNWATRTPSEAVVDLGRQDLVSWKDLEPSDPPIRAVIINRIEEVVKADARWQEAARKRGVRDFSRVSILPSIGEGQKLPVRSGDRVIRPFCFLRDDTSSVPIMTSIRIEVNLTRGTLTQFEDKGPEAAANVRKSANTATRGTRPELRRLRTVQPEGPSFRQQVSEVRWQNWRLHYGVHPRRGLELYDVTYEDAGRARPILYRASVSEMIAPYGDPSYGSWYPQDEGDYGMASYGRNSAIPLDDAPSNAVFASAVIADSRGNPVEIPRAVAIYERDGGLLWRHGMQARRARKLVLTAYSTIDNYDYAFNWIFGQDGTIEVEVLLTGMMNIRNVKEQREDERTHLSHPMFGHLVAPGVNAPNHQHFFSFRLDFDIDGPGNNTVLELNTESAPVGEGNQKGEAFSMTARPLRTEQEAQRMMNLGSSRKWKVVSTRDTNSLGQLSGYALLPGENSIPYAAPDSAPRRKAGFINAHLWVTPYSPDEMFASGEYVNFNLSGEGLPKWTGANRAIEDRDIVVWYTLGVTHIPRTEDWPVMPVHPTGFRLVPAGFFSQNPAMDAPASNTVDSRIKTKQPVSKATRR
jgi:primary-amine oxidase